VRQACHRARFGHQALGGDGRQLRQRLECHVAAERHVARAVHHAHAAGAEPLDEVEAEHAPRQGRRLPRAAARARMQARLATFDQAAPEALQRHLFEYLLGMVVAAAFGPDGVARQARGGSGHPHETMSSSVKPSALRRALRLITPSRLLAGRPGSSGTSSSIWYRLIHWRSVSSSNE
jgi:hypothetical protein